MLMEAEDDPGRWTDRTKENVKISRERYVNGTERGCMNKNVDLSAMTTPSE